MGVDRYSWAGYGVTGPIDEPSDLLRESTVPAPIRAALDNEDYDVETQLDDWLSARGITLVTVHVSGNSWSGVERWNVTADGSITSVAEDDPVQFLEQPSEQALAELEQALEMLGIDRKPGWMLQMDVN